MMPLFAVNNEGIGINEPHLNIGNAYLLQLNRKPTAAE